MEEEMRTALEQCLASRAVREMHAVKTASYPFTLISLAKHFKSDVSRGMRQWELRSAADGNMSGHNSFGQKFDWVVRLEVIDFMLLPSSSAAVKIVIHVFRGRKRKSSQQPRV